MIRKKGKKRHPRTKESLWKVNGNEKTIGLTACPSKITRFKKTASSCGICYNYIEKQGQIESCKHEFCFICIKKWSQTENTCPICKKRFTKIEIKWKRQFYGEQPRKQVHKSECTETGNVNVQQRNQSGQSKTSIASLLMEAFDQNAIVPLHRLVFSTGTENRETYAIRLRLAEREGGATDTLFITRLTSDFGE